MEKKSPKAGIIRRGLQFKQRGRNVIEEERHDQWVESGSWESRWLVWKTVSLEEV